MADPLCVHVTTTRGCGIKDCIRDAVRLARLWETYVDFEFAGVMVRVWSGSRVGEVATGYRQALAEKESEVKDANR